MTSRPVKRKIRKKKKRKVKPVEVLRHCMKILPILINCRLGKNEIFRKIRELKQVGLNDKSDTLDALDQLKKGGLIEEIEDGQDLFQQLSTLGNEIAHMILWTNEYRKSHNELVKIARNHFNINLRDFEPKALKSILKNGGWVYQDIEDSDEILYYKHSRRGIHKVMEFSGQILKDGLIKRYMDILEGYNNISNLGKYIINNLIIGAISYQLGIAERYGYNIGVMHKDDLFSFVGDLRYPYPKLIFDVVRDMIVSDLNILGISKEEITEELKRIKKDLKIKPILPDPDMLARLDKYGVDYPWYKNSRILIAAYTEYLRRLNSS